MLPMERQEKLVEILEQKKCASIAELAHALYISEASIRRDVAHLEERGCVRRIYGGVTLSRYENAIVPLELRDGDHTAVKEMLAKRAAEKIRDGDTVILDASSTVRRMLKYMTNRKNLTIITNNLRIFTECSIPDVHLYCTGGTYRPYNHVFTGDIACRFLRTVRADAVFFSSQGISDTGEISDASEEETTVRRVMLERAKHAYFLCDSSKIGVQKTFTLCHKDALTEIICDVPLPWEKK